ncbi:MAG: sirohydrochlorin cobaltochelatase [Thermodesulfobacteriota bacterium]
MHPNGYIGRKMHISGLQQEPALIIAAFGSSKKSQPALDLFRRQLKVRFPDREIFWGYTSEIIRKKLGLPGVHETLAQVESQGFRKAVVQPLHIFPGSEYRHLAETCEYFPGLRVFLGETLLHRWKYVNDILAVVEQDFFSADRGCNLLALHGTSLTADPVNSGYLGLERLVLDRYPNVFAASVEGVPDFRSVFARLTRENIMSQYKRVRIIPMMYLTGFHVENDLMGDQDSWRTMLEEHGLEVECPERSHGNEKCFKGLGFYPEVAQTFIQRLERGLELADHF